MFGSEQYQQARPSFPNNSTQSWYPPSMLSPSSSSSPTSSNSNMGRSSGPSLLSKANSAGKSRSDSRSGSLASHSQSSSAAFASTFPPLREKSGEELKKLLIDKEAYHGFLHSLDQVKSLDSLQDDLKKNNIELAEENLEKESQIAELRNQCTIIRATELAGAQERLDAAQKREREVNGQLNMFVLINKLQEAADEIDNESENLHRQFLAGEVELIEFTQNYRKLRMLYHRRILTRLAAVSLRS